MKLPVMFFARLLPLDSSLAAAVALTAVYGLLSILAYAYFAVWRYSPYLSAALGAGGKFLGFLLRSIFLVNHDINVWAAATVFLTAGMSACTSAQAAVLSDWFKNASAARRLGFHQRHPRALPAACRLMSIPVLVFGPGIGVPAAILMYGVRTPVSASDAMTIRKWSAWGTLACLAVLTALALLALVLAALQQKQQGSAPSEASAACAKRPLLVAAPTLLSLVLIQISGAARVRALYQPSVATNDHLWYCLIVLPELLQQLLTSVPTLLARAGFADSYAGWRTAAWGWVRRAFPVSTDPAVPAAAGAAPAHASKTGQSLERALPAGSTHVDNSTSLAARRIHADSSKSLASSHSSGGKCCLVSPV